MNETRIPQPRPEQLVKLLDAQLHMTRGRRTEDTGQRRIVVLVGGLLFIVVACGAALLILQHLLSDLRERGAAQAPQSSDLVWEMKFFKK